MFRLFCYKQEKHDMLVFKKTRVNFKKRKASLNYYTTRVHVVKTILFNSALKMRCLLEIDVINIRNEINSP